MKLEFLSIFFLLFPLSLFSQKSIGLYIGLSDYDNFGHRDSRVVGGYEESESLINVGFYYNIVRARKKYNYGIVYQPRSVFVSTTTKYSHRSATLKASNLQFMAKVGRFITKKPLLYWEFGGYIGIPLRRKAYEEWSQIIPWPFSLREGINTDPKEFWGIIEPGITTALGFQIRLSKLFTFFTETSLNIGYNYTGREYMSRTLDKNILRLGINYELEAIQ